MRALQHADICRLVRKGFIVAGHNVDELMNRVPRQTFIILAVSAILGWIGWNRQCEPLFMPGHGALRMSLLVDDGSGNWDSFCLSDGVAYITLVTAVGAWIDGVD